MSDLSQVLSTRGWTWSQIKNSGHASDGHWLAIDTDGNCWLSKLRGSFYAYREITFAKLAQEMGWSCQSSIYIKLDTASAKLLGRPTGEVHSAHWFLDEHASKPCSATCPMQPLVGLEVRSAEDLEGIAVAHLFDWPKSEFAAFIFGANEPSGRLFTSSHEFVIIDNEQMFSTGPCAFESAHWLRGLSGHQYHKGIALAAEVCASIAGIKPEQLTTALSIPRGVRIERGWLIRPKIKQSIAFALEYERARAGA